MKLAIMQPYLFPYLGYYQLVYRSDVFVFYDDVNFPKRGYVNRNSILMNGNVTRFTVPLIKASQNKLINEISCQGDLSKVIATIRQAYSKAPYFNDVMPIIESVLSSSLSISEMAASSTVEVFKYLNVERVFVHSSSLEYNRDSNAQDKLISICKLYEVSEYINSIGGYELYSKDSFLDEGISLQFLKKKPISYKQGGDEFIDNLSIIDLLMYCSKSEIKKFLNDVEII
ncbi:WbqC family protein [Vibrio harveyi]|uniref:WbqC family protein n=1 Tax=Vibrio harveyi TaxID=669 RepID=UPI003AACC80F